MCTLVDSTKIKMCTSVVCVDLCMSHNIMLQFIHQLQLSAANDEDSEIYD